MLLVFSLVLATFSLAAAETKYHPVGNALDHKLQTVEHKAYALGYCECWEQPAWVVEQLTTNSFGSVSRKDNFRADPSVKTGSSALADYKNSGYDRGHMAPSADFTNDAVAQDESFYLSNISPQVPSLNQNAWAKLEKWVRATVTGDMKLIVVTGPVVTGAVERIGKNGVVVPHGYYKVMYTPNDPPRMIGFYYENKKGNNTYLMPHVRTVDEIEKLTGLDFFKGVPDEEELEAESEFAEW